MRYDHPDLRQHLASAYAFGSLTPRVRARFERLLKNDPALRALVAEAELRLAPLALALEPKAPPASVWPAIEQRLGFIEAKASSRWFDWLLRPAMGWAAAGAVIGMVGGQFLPGLGPEAMLTEQTAALTQLPPSYVGVLADEAGGAGLLVSSLRHGHSADFKFVQPATPPAGQVFYLWGLPADGSAPIPVGPLPEGRTGSVALPGEAETLFFGVSKLGVTLEAAGATPTTPRLPYRYLGFCGKFWP